MKDLGYQDFVEGLEKTNKRVPLYGQIELTYRCPSNCIHCYNRNQSKKELDSFFWKGIIDQIHAQGGIELTLTGGDPLIYPDFSKVYRYARNRGFLINIFISGCFLSREILNLLEELPPLNIEITLNSLDRNNYEKITQTKDVFDIVMQNIYEIKRRKIPLVLKCNGMKENKGEILKIKKFAEGLLGKGKFKFDSFIFPGLNGENTKLHRLEPEEIIDIEASDNDMVIQRKEELSHQSQWFNPDGLYHCNSWFRQYFISPQGILKPCHLTKECSTDLKKESFEKGFDKFIELLEFKYKSESKCISCKLKEYCYKCPSRAFLETGNAESPVEYYCRLAKMRKNGIRAKI